MSWGNKSGLLRSSENAGLHFTEACEDLFMYVLAYFCFLIQPSSYISSSSEILRRRPSPTSAMTAELAEEHLFTLICHSEPGGRKVKQREDTERDEGGWRDGAEREERWQKSGSSRKWEKTLLGMKRSREKSGEDSTPEKHWDSVSAVSLAAYMPRLTLETDAEAVRHVEATAEAADLSSHFFQIS